MIFFHYYEKDVNDYFSFMNGLISLTDRSFYACWSQSLHCFDEGHQIFPYGSGLGFRQGAIKPVDEYFDGVCVKVQFVQNRRVLRVQLVSVSGGNSSIASYL